MRNLILNYSHSNGFCWLEKVETSSNMIKYYFLVLGISWVSTPFLRCESGHICQTIPYIFTPSNCISLSILDAVTRITKTLQRTLLIQVIWNCELFLNLRKPQSIIKYPFQRLYTDNLNDNPHISLEKLINSMYVSKKLEKNLKVLRILLLKVMKK